MALINHVISGRNKDLYLSAKEIFIMYYPANKLGRIQEFFLWANAIR